MKHHLSSIRPYLQKKITVAIMLAVLLFVIRITLHYELPEKYMSFGEHSMLFADVLFLKGKSSE